MEKLLVNSIDNRKQDLTQAIDAERSRNLAIVKDLLSTFTVAPKIAAPPAACQNCETGKVLQRDKVESAGGSGVFYTTLTYCDTCGDHEVGNPQWTCDY